MHSAPTATAPWQSLCLSNRYLGQHCINLHAPLTFILKECMGWFQLSVIVIQVLHP